jgi:phosphoserine aminotransferase
LRIPAGLLPADGRFGSGPSKVRAESVAGLAATGVGYLGTSHRRDGVKDVVRRIRTGITSLLGAPDGYEVVLGNGGSTFFWDIAAVCLVTERAQLLSFGEFSAKFASAVASANWLKPPTVFTAPAGQAPAPRPETGIDAYCWPHNETSTGVVLPVVRPNGADRGSLVLVDATSAAGAIPVDLRETDAYYFAPQKVFGSDGGLWLAVLSPAAIERVEQLRGNGDWHGRWAPAALDLSIAIAQSRLDQTYNTPALATLWLVADQIDWVLAQGGLPWAVARSAESAQRLYSWVANTSYAEFFVADPDKRSPTVGTVRFDDSVAATSVATVLRDNGILDTEAYRGAGYNGLRIGMFPAVDPDDVSALTACIDWVVERLA